MSPIIKNLIEGSPHTFERYVVTALIQSYRYYRTHRDVLCEFDEERRSWKKDFSTPRYNLLYQAIDTYWRWQDLPLDQDYFIEKDILKDLLIDEANQGGADPKTVADLIEEIDNDFYRSNGEVAVKLAGGEAFDHWFNIRLGKRFINEISNASQISFIRADNLQAMVAAQTKGLVARQNRNVASGGDIMAGHSTMVQRVPCSILGINKAIGGGFGLGEATMIGALSGGGKTILACQLAFDFASAGIPTMIITTEQKPYELIQRIVSNACTIKMSEFIERKDYDPTNLGEQTLLNIPEHLWNNPLYASKISDTHRILGQYLYCVDWSGGIPGDDAMTCLKREIEIVEAQGWSPRAIIFDWIGGSIDKAAAGDKLRLVYQSTADGLIKLGQRTNRAIIFTAQLHRGRAIRRKIITQEMFAECPSMGDNCTTILGISSLPEVQEAGDDGGSSRNFATRQFINAMKARKGPGGLIPVDTNFQYQRFRDPQRAGGIRGGG